MSRRSVESRRRRRAASSADCWEIPAGVASAEAEVKATMSPPPPAPHARVSRCSSREACPPSSTDLSAARSVHPFFHLPSRRRPGAYPAWCKSTPRTWPSRPSPRSRSASRDAGSAPPPSRASRLTLAPRTQTMILDYNNFHRLRPNDETRRAAERRRVNSTASLSIRRVSTLQTPRHAAPNTNRHTNLPSRIHEPLTHLEPTIDSFNSAVIDSFNRAWLRRPKIHPFMHQIPITSSCRRRGWRRAPPRPPPARAPPRGYRTSPWGSGPSWRCR